ncbi:polysaccharide pyruvyl transferase family protein [Micrococcaceae bacterium RIT802]|nr:polysaccharide pyruvyl transferase family protein [Micrococcaceae bacterium RIT 802]
MTTPAHLPAQRTPRDVLLVGAYERDNFGDLLFLLMTERYLPTDRVTAAAPMAADMSAVFGRYIPAYGPLLKTHAYDTVWTVGGEIGSVSLGAAYNYSLSPGMLSVYQACDAAGRSAIRRSLSSDIDTDLAYVPTLRDFGLNAGARQVLNSVGISAVNRLKPEERDRVIGKIAAAETITVRDRASSALLAEHGIEHTLGPDMVHSISVVLPSDDVASEPYVCFHAASSYVRSAGADAIAGQLVAIAGRTGLGIHLFVAGLASGHDSLARYEEIRDACTRRSPQVKVTISASRDPLDLARSIRQSQGWIGTSLHGRIIAGSYGLPRVSLSKSWKTADLREKTAVYAATWDDAMPHAVALEQIPTAFAQSTSSRLKSRAAETGRELAWAAHRNMVQTVG